MNLHDPDNRLGRPVPYASTVEDFTLEGARIAASNCPRCTGAGLTPIFSPRYTGSAVERTIHPQRGVEQVLRRAVAYCICPAGRKIAVMHQQESKDVFLRTPDLHDVVDGKYVNWQAEDPTINDNEPLDVSELPESFRRLAAKMRTPKIYEPVEAEPHEDESTDEYDEPYDDHESQAAS